MSMQQMGYDPTVKSLIQYNSNPPSESPSRADRGTSKFQQEFVLNKQRRLNNINFINKHGNFEARPGGDGSPGAVVPGHRHQHTLVLKKDTSSYNSSILAKAAKPQSGDQLLRKESGLHELGAHSDYDNRKSSIYTVKQVAKGIKKPTMKKPHQDESSFDISITQDSKQSYPSSKPAKASHVGLKGKIASGKPPRSHFDLASTHSDNQSRNPAHDPTDTDYPDRTPARRKQDATPRKYHFDPEEGKFMRLRRGQNQDASDSPSGTQFPQLSSQKSNAFKNQQSMGKGIETQSHQSQQPTATSDFMNRFKGKLSTVQKEGHIGVAAHTKKPIQKLDLVGYKSGMSHVQSYIPSESFSGVSMVSGHSSSQYNIRKKDDQSHYYPHKSKSVEKYRPFVQNTEHKLEANVARLRQERAGLRPQEEFSINKIDLEAPNYPFNTPDHYSQKINQSMQQNQISNNDGPLGLTGSSYGQQQAGQFNNWGGDHAQAGDHRRGAGFSFMERNSIPSIAQNDLIVANSSNTLPADSSYNLNTITVKGKPQIFVSPYKRMASNTNLSAIVDQQNFNYPPPGEALQFGYIKKPEGELPEERGQPYRSNSLSQLDPLRQISPIYQQVLTEEQQAKQQYMSNASLNPANNEADQRRYKTPQDFSAQKSVINKKPALSGIGGGQDQSMLPSLKIRRQEPSGVMTVHNEKHLFGQMVGLGPVNIGTEEWSMAKIKKERMNSYATNVVRK